MVSIIGKISLDGIKSVPADKGSVAQEYALDTHFEDTVDHWFENAREYALFEFRGSIEIGSYQYFKHYESFGAECIETSKDVEDLYRIKSNLCAI